MTGPEATPAAASEAPAAAAAPKAKPAAKKAAPKVKPAPKPAAKKPAPKVKPAPKPAAKKAAAPKVDEPSLNKTQADEVLTRLAAGARLEAEQKRLKFFSVAGLRHAMEVHVDQPVYRKAVTKGRAVLAKKLAAKK